MRTIVRENKTATQDLLICKLNPVIRGWVNYHRYVVSADIFGLVDHRIFECLWRWACRRHKRKGKRWIANKYWHHIDNRTWTFATEPAFRGKDFDEKYLKLEYAANTKIIRFRKIAAEANPFDEKWTGYYEERDGERMLNSTKGREKLVKSGTTRNGAALYVEKELHPKQDSRGILSPKTTENGPLLWYIPGVIEICMRQTT